MVIDGRVGAEAAVAGVGAESWCLVLAPAAVWVDIGVNVGGAHGVCRGGLITRRARGWW